MKILVISLAIVTSLAGCATGPVYPKYTAQDAACVKGDIANFIKFFSDGEAHVQIKEIDGIPTGGGEPYCFAPGKHRLGVSAHNNYQTAQDYVDLEFDSGKKYWLSANLRGISFVFQLVDITAHPEIIVADFRLKVSSTSQPVTVPIFIPSK